MTQEASEKMQKYFDSISSNVDSVYNIAQISRSLGFDPEDTVAIPLANNMAERVEGLISVVEPKIKNSGISKRINELEGKFGKLNWKVAFTISLETAQEKFCTFDSKLKAMETGIRVGLAYLTLGVVASPLEGFVELKLKKRNSDAKDYFCLMFSGPIRSAGGTAAAVTVLVADYIRKKMGFSAYDPTEIEIKRSVRELYDYHERITNLQYLPSEEEIEFLAKNIPIQVDGDASEKIEVSNHKDIPRINSNRIRNGFCLVFGECLCQKAAKLQKQLADWGEEFDMSQWAFLDDFVKLQKTKKAKKTEQKTETKIQPDYTFIKDLVAGRPILGFPLRNGGFRLRYGRSRNTGYSSTAIHPAATYILDKFVAIGTQLKLERPGKAASVSMCDSIDGPIVRLSDGSVMLINDIATAKQVTKSVQEILYLGDMLINYGDFFNRAHSLVPPGYCEEWWIQELEKSSSTYSNLSELASYLNLDESRLQKIVSFPDRSITSAEAISISSKLKIPLHPKFSYYWDSISTEDLQLLISSLKDSKIITEGTSSKIVIALDSKVKRILEIIGIPHTLATNEYIVILNDESRIIEMILSEWKKIDLEKTPLENINTNSHIVQRDKLGTFIGARMGRPEKAKVRKMDGQPHCLFPVGDEGGRLRSFQSTLDAKKITSDFPIYRCSCENETVLRICEKCGKKTTPFYFCRTCNLVMNSKKCPKHGDNSTYRTHSIDISSIFKNTVNHLKLSDYPDLIKGVRGTSNKDHIPEHIAKGILRAKHNIPVNKDGTTRYDMTQLAITHFKPLEIGTSVDVLRNLGYTTDLYGNELVSDSQTLELFPQDLILPKCTGAIEEGADEILFRCSKFVDELLSRLYSQTPFYNLKNKQDLAGSLVVALAPHTSAGIVGRIVGFSKTQGFYAHPMFHAATRRDCDGDEACVTLLLDAMLNFSRQYLPNTRGATQDAPLVLTSKLIPSEVDDMVFDIDICQKYPLEFYEAALDYKKPWDIKISQINDKLNSPGQYEGMGFTHPVTDISHGVKCSAYKLLPSMQEKLHGQMDLAVKIRAVDESEVAKIVIERHFIKDIKGNLRKFSQQQFRCVACNEKYRRPPLIGRCTKCSGKIIFTISEGSIVKYLEPALSLAEHYHLPKYVIQTLELTKQRVESIFGKDKEKQEGLGKWF